MTVAQFRRWLESKIEYLQAFPNDARNPDDYSDSDDRAGICHQIERTEWRCQGRATNLLTTLESADSGTGVARVGLNDRRRKLQIGRAAVAPPLAIR